MNTLSYSANLRDIQRQLRMAESLRQVVATLNASLDRETVFATVAEQLQKMIGYDRMCIMLHEGDQLYIVYAIGDFKADIIGTSFSIDHSLGGITFAEQNPIIVSNVQTDSRWLAYEGTGKIRGWMGLPLLIQGKAIGVLVLDSYKVGTYQATDITAMQAFANQVAIAIENARLYEAEQKARRTAEIARQANIALTQSLALDDILQILLDYLAQLVPYDSANVFLLQSEDSISPVALRKYEQWVDDVEAIKQMRFNTRENKSFHDIFEKGRSLIIDDVTVYPDWETHKSSQHIRSWLGIPLIVGGQVIGCFSLDKIEPSFFTQEHLQAAEMLALQTAVSIQNAQLLEKAQNSAKELRIAGQVLQLLNATPTVADAFPKIAKIIKSITNGSRISLTTLDSSHQWATMISLDQPAPVLDKDVKFPITITACAENVLAGKINITPDLSQEIDFPAEKMLFSAGHRSRINVPLLVGKQILGSINVVWDYENGFDATLLPMMKQIAGGIALAMERARLFTESQQQAHQLVILNQLGRKLTSSINIVDLCELVVQTLADLLGYLSVSILLADKQGQYLKLQAIEGPHKGSLDMANYRQAYGQGLIGLAALTGKPIIANNAPEHPDFLPSKRINIQSELSLPLKLGDQVIGVLNVDSEQQDAFTDNDLSTLTIVADQLAIAIEKARLFEETERHTNELEVIIDVSMALREAEKTDEMVAILLAKVTQYVHGQMSRLYLRDPETDELVARGVYPYDPALLDLRLQPGQGISGWVMRTGRPHISQDWRNEKLSFVAMKEMAQLANLHSNIALPLRTQADIIGVMHISLAEQRPFTDGEVRLLTAVAEVAGTSLERAQLLETLEQRVIERTRALEEANQQLQELDRLKSKFVSDVSHELRTPITNLVLYLDLMARGKPNRQGHYLDILRLQAKRLTDLIEDILSLSRLEIGGDKVELSPIDLNEIVRQTTATYKPRIEEGDLRLEVDLQTDLPLILGERNQLMQVIVNLLSNAINYTPAGQITATTIFDEAEKEVCLAIRDTGIGIPADDQSFLFDRFYRGQEIARSNIPGTGLGLAIVHEIVQLHNGTISVTSEADVGTTFTICLPVIKDES